MCANSPQPRVDFEERRAADLLEGWKSISDYLGKTERTLQRWEKSRGLPVRRLRAESPEEQPRVYAYRSELDAWWNRQTGLDDEAREPVAVLRAAEEQQHKASSREKPRLPMGWAVAGVGLLLVFPFAAILLRSNWPQIRERWPSKAKMVLVVRPFTNLSGDAGQDYIAAGFTEEMVTRLGEVHPDKMAVIRLSPAYATAAPERLGKDIHAHYVLAGSVRRVNERVAIAAQLVQVSNQAVVWGESYDRDVRDLLQIQSEVAAAIAHEVLNKLPHDSAPPRQVNRDAYLHYLEGRYFWNKRTAESLTEAVRLFEKSIQADPGYAPSYAGLADCYALLASAPYTALPPNEAFPKAEAAAKQALHLDDSLAEAHASLGYAQLVYEWNLAEARKEFTRALELKPDYPTGHQFYAYYLTAIGDLDGAIAQRTKAVEQDPINPLMSTALGEAYYHARQFDLTIEQNSRSLQLDPGYAIALLNLGRAYQQKGMHREAREVFGKILAASPDAPAVLALQGYDYGVTGERSEADAVIAKLEGLSGHGYVPSLYIALVYTGLGDKDHAFAWLDKAYAERCEYLVYLPTEPLADPLRGDLRFARLLRKLNSREGQ